MQVLLATTQGEPAAIALHPKPRNYTDPAWQARVSDDHIRDTIVKGEAGVGKSPRMAPNPDLAYEPAELDAFVRKARFLRRLSSGRGRRWAPAGDAGTVE